uniref:Fibronectin type-III domain-containing protein n=2 Tax=Engystomops pustulosus TaxID=76066 RepID=A0AAV6YST2_ENGPU|nr:hypothetical protein GDO81_019818 [Engystomops pustulosus]
MMSGGDAGGSRNACFALTCLVTSPAGHQHVLKSRHIPGVLDTLCRLLQSPEQDSRWFAAITVKGISKFPSGVLRLRQHQTLESILKNIAASHTAGEELLQEVEATLQNLQRLPQPDPPTAKILESGSVMVTWKEHRPHSGLTITYSLYDGERLLYHGPSFSYVIPHCKSGHHHLKVVMETEGDRGPASAITLVTVEEPLPGCPRDLQVVGRTATKVKLSWSPPAEPATGVKYVVYREDTLVETTSDLTCIVGGLEPSTSYTFSVCSCNSRGHSPRVPLTTRTMDRGDHAPDRLTLYVIGRSEMFITWEGPKDPIGRFFNYELSMNGKSVYLGTERSYTARRLTPSTEYTCTVCAITSEGRYESRPVTKRTARDEYSNLHKSQAAGSRHAPSSPTAEAPDHSEKPSRRSSLTKSQSVRLVMSKQNRKAKRDGKVLSPARRRDSIMSWTAEPSDSPITSPSSLTKPSSPSDITPGQNNRNPQETQKCTEQTEGSGDPQREQSPGRNPAAASPKPTKQTPDIQSCPSPEAKKPQSALGFRLTPIASLCNLEPKYLLHSRAKTESELLRPTLQDGPLPPSLIQECPRVLENDRCSVQKKTLQPVRGEGSARDHHMGDRHLDRCKNLLTIPADPIVRYRHRSLRVNAWDTTAEKKWYKFSATCPLTPSEDAVSHLSSTSRSLQPRAAGPLDGRRHSWSHLRSDVSSLQGLKGAEEKSVESLRGQRNKALLPGAFQKGLHVLIGESGVTFRLPPAPISIAQRVRPHH